MNDDRRDRRTDQTGWRIVRALVTVAVFGLVGPLIAGLVVIGGLALFEFDSPGEDFGAMFVAMTIFGMRLAYTIGAVPAVLVGVFFAVVDFRRRRSGLLLAVVVGLLAGIGWRYVISRWETSPLDNWMIVGSLVSTVVCWRICRRRPAAHISGDAAA